MILKYESNVKVFVNKHKHVWVWVWISHVSITFSQHWSEMTLPTDTYQYETTASTVTAVCTHVLISVINVFSKVIFQKGILQIRSQVTYIAIDMKSWLETRWGDVQKTERVFLWRARNSVVTRQYNTSQFLSHVGNYDNVSANNPLPRISRCNC